jgi:hypothetical protein
MDIDGHKKKADEIENSLNELLPDPNGQHVVAIVELTYGLLQHMIAVGMEAKYGRHVDSHVGLPRELRKVGAVNIAELFVRLDSFRAGRWYGSKGNGNIVRKCLEFIENVKKWAEL